MIITGKMQKIFELFLEFKNLDLTKIVNKVVGATKVKTADTK